MIWIEEGSWATPTIGLRAATWAEASQSTPPEATATAARPRVWQCPAWPPGTPAFATPTRPSPTACRPWALTTPTATTAFCKLGGASLPHFLTIYLACMHACMHVYIYARTCTYNSRKYIYILDACMHIYICMHV